MKVQKQSYPQYKNNKGTLISILSLPLLLQDVIVHSSFFAFLLFDCQAKKRIISNYNIFKPNRENKHVS